MESDPKAADPEAASAPEAPSDPAAASRAASRAAANVRAEVDEALAVAGPPTKGPTVGASPVVSGTP